MDLAATLTTGALADAGPVSGMAYLTGLLGGFALAVAALLTVVPARVTVVPECA